MEEIYEQFLKMEDDAIRDVEDMTFCLSIISNRTQEDIDHLSELRVKAVQKMLILAEWEAQNPPGEIIWNEEQGHEAI